MLVLSRRIDEGIVIGDDVVITVVEIKGDVVRLGIAAPREVVVDRHEVRAAAARDGRRDGRRGGAGDPPPMPRPLAGRGALRRGS